MDQVLIGAADDVVVGDGDGVDAAPAGLQDVDALQGADVPNLTDGGRRLLAATAANVYTSDRVKIKAAEESTIKIT